LQRSTKSLSFRSGMSTLIDTARSAVFRDGQIVISLVRGAKIQFPVAENPRLARGTPEQLNNIELSPFGLHWPDLDDDLSLRGIAQGDYGQSRTRRSSE
jgi:hypothetical protein